MRQAASRKARNAMTSGLRWADQKKNHWCVGSLQIKGFKHGRMSCLFNEVILNPNPANRRVWSLDSFSVFNSRFLTVFIEFINKRHHKIAEILMTNRPGVFMVWRVLQLKFRRPFPGSIRSVRERSSASWTIGSSKRSSWKGRCNYRPRHREWEFKKKTPLWFFTCSFPHEKWPSQKGEKNNKGGNLSKYLCELPFLHLSLFFFLGSFFDQSEKRKNSQQWKHFKHGNYGILIFSIWVVYPK